LTKEHPDCGAIVAQGPHLLFRGTESEISPDAIDVCAVERQDSSDSFLSLHRFGQFREIRLPIRWLQVRPRKTRELGWGIVEKA
jgi:hypothetical protein